MTFQGSSNFTNSVTINMAKRNSKQISLLSRGPNKRQETGGDPLLDIIFLTDMRDALLK